MPLLSAMLMSEMENPNCQMQNIFGIAKDFWGRADQENYSFLVA